MGRHKSGAILKPWLTPADDCKERRFIMVGDNFLLSDSLQELSYSTRLLMLALAMESGGERRVKFGYGTGKKYGFSKSTVQRGVQELIAIEYIQIVNNKDCLQYETNEFEFIFGWRNLSPEDIVRRLSERKETVREKKVLRYEKKKEQCSSVVDGGNAERFSV